MIKNIKLVGHKGISEMFLLGLEQTNIVCGKNSSGKSSILEAIGNDTKSYIGIVPKSTDYMNGFSRLASSYSSPSPIHIQSCFNSTVDKCIERWPIWYKDQLPSLYQELQSALRKDPILKSYNISFDFASVFSPSFDNIKFKPVLVPPKRQFLTKASINLDEDLLPNGSGLVNKLFFLKNHGNKDNEFITYQKIHSIFNEITQCGFNIVPTKNNQLNLQFQIAERWIDAENCGLGLLDLLFIISFIESTDYSTYLIEEPESHLHADFQKKLLKYITSLKAKQFIISTHSNVFIDNTLINKIYYCWFDEKVNLSDQTTISKMIDSLGYSISENLTSDAIILVEGPTDIPIIKKVLSLNGVISNYNIKFWPLGGDIMASIDLSLFAKPTKVFAIIDSDPGSTAVRNKFKKNCSSNNVECKVLNRYSIENYIDLSVIKSVFPGQIKVDELKENESVDAQIGFKDKQSTIKSKNHLMADQMTISHLEGTDLWDWANSVKKELGKVTVSK